MKNGQQKKGAIVDGKMTFGKYAGTPIERVPTEYIEWLVEVREDELKTFKDILADRK